MKVVAPKKDRNNALATIELFCLIECAPLPLPNPSASNLQSLLPDLSISCQSRLYKTVKSS